MIGWFWLWFEIGLCVDFTSCWGSAFIGLAIHDITYLAVMMSCQLANHESDEPSFSFPYFFTFIFIFWSIQSIR